MDKGLKDAVSNLIEEALHTAGCVDKECGCNVGVRDALYYAATEVRELVNDTQLTLPIGVDDEPCTCHKA